jgi:hypothetical protein
VIVDVVVVVDAMRLIVVCLFLFVLFYLVRSRWVAIANDLFEQWWGGTYQVLFSVRIRIRPVILAFCLQVFGFPVDGLLPECLRFSTYRPERTLPCSPTSSSIVDSLRSMGLLKFTF